MFGIFKGRDRTVVATTSYLSGICFCNSLSFSALRFSFWRLSHGRRFVMSGLCWDGGAAGAPLGANVGEYLLLAPCSVFIFVGVQPVVGSWLYQGNWGIN